MRRLQTGRPSRRKAPPVAALIAGIAVLFAPARPAAAELAVVVTSKPIHALVAGVMDGIGTPRLIVAGSQSPHTYSLKPSDTAALHRASLVFRVSEAIEPFTRRLFDSLPGSVRRVSLAGSPGIELLTRRRGPAFEQAAHAGHPQPAAEATSDTAGADGHVWLDPRNARAMVEEIARALAAASPADADRVRANAAALSLRLDALDRELDATLASVRERPFVVFHDAVQYLERRYRLTAAGAVVVSPDTPPSGQRLSAVRKRIMSLAAVCVFGEPTVSARMLATVTEGTGARAGVIDPEGTALPAGGDHYVALMRGLARSLVACLSARG